MLISHDANNGCFFFLHSKNEDNSAAGRLDIMVTCDGKFEYFNIYIPSEKVILKGQKNFNLVYDSRQTFF